MSEGKGNGRYETVCLKKLARICDGCNGSLNREECESLRIKLYVYSAPNKIEMEEIGVLGENRNNYKLEI